MSVPTPQPHVSSSDMENLFDAFNRLKIDSKLTSNDSLDGESQIVSSSLNSLPVEILQNILSIVIEEGGKKIGSPARTLRRVLALQSVCAYVRDVIRGTPEFWTSLSSAKPDIFPVQLERSKGFALNLDLYVPHLKDDRVSEFFQRCAGQWRSLHVLVPGVAYTQLFCDDKGMAKLGFDKVEEVYMHYAPVPPDEPGMDYIPFHGYHMLVFDYLAKRMPNLKHLYMKNRQPNASITTNLTSFHYDHDHNSGLVYGFMLQFVNSQPLMNSLSFPMREDRVTFMDTYPKTLGNRNMEWTITLDGLYHPWKFDPIFYTFKRVGIIRLNIDYTEAINDPKCNRFFCHLLDLLSGEHALALNELSFTLPSHLTLPCTSACVESSSEKVHRLPQSLQALRVYNASQTVLDVMRQLVKNLVMSQKAAGVPSLGTFEVTEAL